MAQIEQEAAATAAKHEDMMDRPADGTALGDVDMNKMNFLMAQQVSNKKGGIPERNTNQVSPARDDS